MPKKVRAHAPPRSPQPTFQGHPVLLPLATGHQLQLSVFVQGDQGFEGKPPGSPHHALLLLKQQVQLLQRALRRLAAAVALLGASGRVWSVSRTRAGPAYPRFQLPHEVLINILPERVAGRRLVDGARRMGPGRSREPEEAGDLRRGAGVRRQAVHAAVEGVAEILGPGLLLAHRHEKEHEARRTDGRLVDQPHESGTNVL